MKHGSYAVTELHNETPDVQNYLSADLLYLDNISIYLLK